MKMHHRAPASAQRHQAVLRRRRKSRCSDFFALDMPLVAGDRISDDQKREKSAADAPDLQHVWIGAAEPVVIDAVDRDPDQQCDTGENFIEDEPAVPADYEVARSENDNSA